MKFPWRKNKEARTTEILDELKSLFSEEASDAHEFDWTEIGPNFNGLPIIVADDDFFEYLAEESYSESIEFDELVLVYEEWAAENVL
jgi:hypothetical protein